MNIAFSKFGLKLIVKIKVSTAMRASCFSTCQAFIIGENFMRLKTAKITIQARVARGRW
jgi:hypothetical protein